MFSFNFNPIDGYVFVNVYIDSEEENKGYGVEAIVLFVHYLFIFLPIRKVCFEIFSYNNLSLSTMQNGSKYGFCEEGRFREHRFLTVIIMTYFVLQFIEIQLIKLLKFYNVLEKNNMLDNPFRQR